MTPTPFIVVLDTVSKVVAGIHISGSLCKTNSYNPPVNHAKQTRDVRNCLIFERMPNYSIYASKIKEEKQNLVNQALTFLYNLFICASLSINQQIFTAQRDTVHVSFNIYSYTYIMQ